MARLVLGARSSATSDPRTLASVSRLGTRRMQPSRTVPRRYEVDLPDKLEGKTYHEPSGNGEERDPSGR